jgi:hypothetical protein
MGRAGRQNKSPDPAFGGLQAREGGLKIRHGYAMPAYFADAKQGVCILKGEQN